MRGRSGGCRLGGGKGDGGQWASCRGGGAGAELGDGSGGRGRKGRGLVGVGCGGMGLHMGVGRSGVVVGRR